MKNKIKHIVIFASDAFGAYLLKKSPPKTLKKLMDNGAYTLNSRSVVPIFSAVNWNSIFNGLSSNLHGYTEWNSHPPELNSVFVTPEFNKIPSIFYLLKKQQPDAKACAFFRWSQFDRMIELDLLDKWYNLLAIGDDKKWGPTKNSIYVKEENNFIINEKVVDEAIKYIDSSQPTLSLIYVNEPDTTGHHLGHDVKPIYDAINIIDKWVEKVNNMINNNSKMKDNTLFIFCADHGGKGVGDDCHGNFNLDEIEVPIIFSGPMVKKIGQIPEQTIQYDIAATLAWILELKQPYFWNGRPIKSPFITNLEYYEK